MCLRWGVLLDSGQSCPWQLLSKFSLDPKLQFVNFSYKKLYGKNSTGWCIQVGNKLSVLFDLGFIVYIGFCPGFLRLWSCVLYIFRLRYKECNWLCGLVSFPFINLIDDWFNIGTEGGMPRKLRSVMPGLKHIFFTCLHLNCWVIDIFSVSFQYCWYL